MLAVTIENTDLIVTEVPDPVLGPDDVLVGVRAAGINAADLLQRRGLYPAPPGSPEHTPGLELAGTVLSYGAEVSGFAEGDRVMAVVGGGGQAERCVVHSSNLLRAPDAVDDLTAGGFAEAFITAHDAMVTRGGLQEGSRVLVTGAAGGVGTAAIQIGALFGAEVVASVRDATRRNDVLALGAQHAVDPGEVADYGPFDLVLELVGAASLSDGVLRSLAKEARVVVIGVGGGSRIDVDLLGLMNARATIGGATLRPRSIEEKARAIHAAGDDLLDALAAGKLRVPLLATFPLTEAPRAYDRFAQGSKFGKIVLSI